MRCCLSHPRDNIARAALMFGIPFVSMGAYALKIGEAIGKLGKPLPLRKGILSRRLQLCR